MLFVGKSFGSHEIIQPCVFLLSILTSFCSSTLVLKGVERTNSLSKLPKDHLKVTLGILNKEEQFSACFGTVLNLC